MLLHDTIQITEPLRGKTLMIALNTRVVQHDLLIKILPISADLFVFVYPFYLVALYLRGIKKQQKYFQYASFAIAFSAGVATLINQIIQYFGDKSRPETAILLKQNLILDHLPTDPFPSDHAAVSFAIAMSTLLWGLKYKDKHFVKMSVFFWIACGVMSFSRVAVAIHRPTDILVWRVIGLCSALLLSSDRVWVWMVRIIILPLIAFQERITTRFKRS